MNFRVVKLLIGAYAALSILTVAAIVVLAGLAPAQVNDQAWVRGIIVAATSLLTLRFAGQAANGRPRALLRLRIIVAIILVAIVAVLLFVHLPAWMVVEQAACGALLLATAAIVFQKPNVVAATERSRDALAVGTKRFGRSRGDRLKIKP